MLLNKQKTLEEDLLLCNQRVSSFCGRVTTLETQQAARKSKTCVLVGRSGSHLTYVIKFVRKLFLEMKSIEGLTAMFDILYDNKKAFCSDVNKKLREVLTPLLQMDLCRQIRKHFAPWRFLEIMDCSKQSLNQVRLYNFSLCE